MKSPKLLKTKRPKISMLHDEIPPHVQEYMHLTRLAEMGRLAANVAHEINNPLMVIQGFAENIDMLLESDTVSNDEIRIQILEILKSCQRMSRIVNKMNRMSRRQKLRLFIVDLAEIALNSVDFLKNQLQQMDIHLEFDFNNPIPIKCDALQVEQIILNILSNALFAVESNRFGDRKIRISFEEFGKWQQIKIWNNGPIIPKELHAQIMTPFFTTKNEAEGTGLGLAVSKAIMQVHSGDLSFQSREDLGTEFVLSFPRPKENPWEKQKRKDRGLVVIVDRADNYRKTLHEKFRLLGFRVEAFPENSAAMMAIQANPDVLGVVVDTVPGDRESTAFVRVLRQELGPEGLIFAMSNFPAVRNSQLELKRVGATECLEKPLHSDNFALILGLLEIKSKAVRLIEKSSKSAA